MERKKSQSKKAKSSLLIGSVCLLLTAALVTAVLLYARLMPYTELNENEIPLIGGGGVQRGSESVWATPSPDDEGATRYYVNDSEQVWSSETDVEIFRIRYDNADDGVYTVESAAGDKVIAPGTSNTYRFKLNNPGDYDVLYTVSLAAWMEGGENPIPIRLRLFDDTGAYWIGSDTEWVEAAAANAAERSETLAPKRNRVYTLEWEWPFEGERGDEYDTALGNAAVQGDVVQHLTIRTVAEVEDYVPTWWEELLEVWGIDDPNVPLAIVDRSGASWSVFNLACMIGMDVLGLIWVGLCIVGKSPEEETAALLKTAGVTPKREHNLWRILVLLPMIAGTVLFFLTENLHTPIVIFDRWSIPMALILGGTIATTLLTKKYRFEKEAEKALKAAQKE